MDNQTISPNKSLYTTTIEICLVGLMTSDGQCMFDLKENNLFSTTHVQHLEDMIFEEVRRVISQLGQDKAPGPDRFLSCFLPPFGISSGKTS